MSEPLQDVDFILQNFNQLEDPRSAINKRHLLGDIIVISIMAVIAGADGPMAIGIWAENNEQWLMPTNQCHPLVNWLRTNPKVSERWARQAKPAA